MENKQNLRLSQAFPPDYTENNQYFATVHSCLESLDSEINLKQIELRELEYEWEANELSNLYKEWFPISYPDSFFEDLYKKRYSTILAVYHPKSADPNQKHLILGCLTYSIQQTDEKILKSSINYLFNEPQALHIQTLGVVNEFRNKGVASRLLNRVIQIANENSNIKYLYLNVVEYNAAAIKFYKKHNFTLVCCRKNYYDIFGQTYDSELYALFTNGGKKAWYEEDYKWLAKKTMQFVNIPGHCYDLCSYLINRLTPTKQ